MRIEVRSVDAGSPQTVVVDSPAGRVAAIWRDQEPDVGDVVDAEVDCVHRRWAEVVIGLAAGEPRPGSLHGVIQRVKNGDVPVLRSGPAITLLEMVGPQPDGLVGTRVANPPTDSASFPATSGNTAQATSAV